MLEILLFIFLGLALGILLGLIPGLHPNMVALIVPAIAGMNIDAANIIAFAVTLAISNTFLDFIPSMLLGAPEPGKELAMLPAHRMLMEGHGYDAVKLAVIGGLGSVVFVTAAMPLIFFSVPLIYEIVKPYTYIALMFIIAVIILSEESNRKMLAAAGCFFLSGMVGLFSASLDIDRTLVLFPILSGMFGVSMLLLSRQEKITPEKKRKDIHVSSRLTRRSIIFGSIGGIFSGMLPGVGSSEISSMASLDKNEKGFIITVGAVTISNTLMALLAIWLIQKPRSGIAVVVDQLTSIGFNEFLLIIFAALAIAGLSAIITLKLARIFTGKIERINYRKINMFVIGLIIAMTIIFTGAYGLLLLGTCTALGIFTNLMGVRRSVLMGVLILPTIIFYLPV